jgi:L,D-peptidoglycan transpeptidase YkuD (ErfK/YbiS/YcfS/YnhG family)
MIRLPYDGHYEELWRQDGLYDLIGVLGWNDSPVQRRRGSAIFLHVARSGYAPTDGCIALGLDDLRQLLARGLTEVLVLSGSS